MRQVIALCCVSLVMLKAQSTPRTDVTAGLAVLGRVWVFVKYAHPRVALGSTDWDVPVLTAIRSMSTAHDDAAVSDVVAKMLATLNDPLTRVVRRGVGGRPSGSDAKTMPRVARLDGAILIDFRNATDFTGLAKQIEGSDNFKDANLLVIDTRTTRHTDVDGERLSSLLAPYLVASPLTPPSPRSATLNPFRQEQTFRAPPLIVPPPGTRDRRAVFIVDATAVLPHIALPLQARGQARIVSVGALPDLDEAVQKIALPGGYMAQVRTQDFALEGRRVELRADAVLEASVEDAAVQKLTQTIFDRAPQRQPVEDPVPILRPEREYGDTKYPDEATRVLAVYRFWGAVKYFFAYPDLMDQPWDGALEEFIPAARAARSELEYQQVIARMAARLQDSHVEWTGVLPLHRWLSGGTAYPSEVVRIVEGKPVVVRLVGKETGELAVGDEILAIDGETVADRIKRIDPFLAYSTPQSRDRKIADRLLRGDRGTRSRVQVRRGGSVLEAHTTERAPSYARVYERDGPVVTILDGNVGYVDVDRLAAADVAPMFRTLKNSRGIIFDMRGYPRGGGSEIFSAVNRKGNPVLSQTYQPQVVAGWQVRTHMIHRLDAYEPDSAPAEKYLNPIAVLIDERAQSAAEFFTQAMKAVADATLIGSPTTGANGTITRVALPGGVEIRFTADDTRRPDGTQFQRRGHHPDIAVSPTIAGIRAGRDEVLERAVKYLTLGK